MHGDKIAKPPYMRPRPRSLAHRATQIIAFAAFLYVVKPASADYLYNITTTANILGTSVNTHDEFTVPSILNAETTISTFSLDVSTVGGTVATVKDIVLDPTGSGGLCSPIVGPCLQVAIKNSYTDTYGFPTAYTSVGTFPDGGGDTITITQVPGTGAVPEPSSWLLLASIASAAALAYRKRSRVRPQRTSIS